MSNFLSIPAATPAHGIYAVIRELHAPLRGWNGRQLVSWNANDVATYAVPAVRLPSDGNQWGIRAPGRLPPADYKVSFYSQLGGQPNPAAD